MTLVLREPFNSTTSAGWSIASSVSIVAGRNGNGLQLGANAGSFSYIFPAALRSDYLVMGWAWRSADIAAGFHSVLSIRDTGPNVTLSFRINTDGSISAYRSSFSNLLGTTAAGVVVANTWHYIELSTRLHDTLGYVVIRVDGVQVLNLTSVDTKSGTFTLFERIEITNSGVGNSAAIWDDLYAAMDSTETFRGNIVVDDQRLARQAIRVAFPAVVPLTEHHRLARQSVRVAFGTLPVSTATVKTWSGSAYVDAPVKVWNGTAFVDAVAVKTWTGTAFV